MTETRGWNSADFVRAAAVVLGLLILMRFLWVARTIFIVTFLGVLFGLALSGGVDWLERHRVRRGLGAVAIAVAFVGLLVGIGAMIAPTLRTQTRELQQKIPESIDQLEQWFGKKTQQLAGQPPGQKPLTPAQQKQQEQQVVRTLRQQLREPMQAIARLLFPFISTTLAAFGALVLIFFIAIYLAAEPDLYRRGLLHLVPRRRRRRVDEVLTDVGEALRRWLLARLTAMLAIGVITGTLLGLLRVPGAVALAVLAALLEFIPFFGPIASAVPAVAIALADSPQKGLYVVLVFIAIQQLEGNLITPLLLERRIDIPPILTIVTVAALGAALGIGGMLIAEPLLAVVLITIQKLYVEDVVGDEIPTDSSEK